MAAADRRCGGQIRAANPAATAVGDSRRPGRAVTAPAAERDGQIRAPLPRRRRPAARIVPSRPSRRPHRRCCRRRTMSGCSGSRHDWACPLLSPSTLGLTSCHAPRSSPLAALPLHHGGVATAAGGGSSDVGVRFRSGGVMTMEQLGGEVGSDVFMGLSTMVTDRCSPDNETFRTPPKMRSRQESLIKSEGYQPNRQRRSCVDITEPRDYSSSEEMVLLF
uniref:Uncharacterized protein n=1 Tax=Leersia perrieri TaxID=77586 RepID=A0A0D9VZ55_9ORYZ